MQKTDCLGRSTFHHIAPQSGIRPTARETRWFKHIARHGPQSSQYLYELTRDTHRCKDTALRQMQKLRAGGFLSLPAQQRATENAEFNPYIYDLTRKGREHLVELGEDEPTVRSTGHWWHGLTVSQVTSSIDIAAARQGVRYIPTHDILAIKGAELAIPMGRSKLIPDQLFALNYGDSFRAFALEVDRGTEPKYSASNRKSWAKSLEQYRQLIDQRLHKAHYGLKANLLVLWVFTSRSKELRFLEMVEKICGSTSAAILTQSVPDRLSRAHRSAPLSELFDQPWNRATQDPLLISNG